MTFWDTSAITPLLWEESESARRRTFLDEENVMVVWYGTTAELESALSRRVREGNIDAEAEKKVRDRLALLAGAWIEVEPTESVRSRAIRLLRSHPLRAGDAFQLAAALAGTEENPEGNMFLTADIRLSTAAKNEGFTVL